MGSMIEYDQLPVIFETSSSRSLHSPSQKCITPESPIETIQKIRPKNFFADKVIFPSENLEIYSRVSEFTNFKNSGYHKSSNTAEFIAEEDPIVVATEI